MNGIFNNSLRAPDLEMGSDVDGILSRILPFIQQQKNDEFNEKNNQFPVRPRLEEISQSVVNQPVNRTNPNFLIDGMTPFEHGSLQQRKREFESKNQLGRDTLDVNKGDKETDNQLNKEKLEVTKDKNQLDAENKAKRTAVYEFKAKNPGMKFIPVKGGNYMFSDPITGDMHDTGIPSGTMTQEEEINLRGDNREEQIKLQGKNQLANIGANIIGRKEIAGINNKGNLDEIAARGKEARETKNINFTKTELPTQTRVKQVNTARQLINTNPELAPFIKFDADGNFSIVQPGKTFSGNPTGPSTEQFKKITESIYGTTPSYFTEGSGKSETKVDTSDKVKVSKDGKEFFLPKDQLAEAVKQGYKEVKK